MNGDQLRAVLRDLGLTHAVFADLCGVHVRQVSKWCCGRHPVPHYAETILAHHAAKEKELKMPIQLYSWIGDDCPPPWRRVGTIDLGDSADTEWALSRNLRIGNTYDGGSDSVAEPCAADIYTDEAP